jgi:hypothetical protein
MMYVPTPFIANPSPYSSDLLSFWDELEVAKQVRSVGHAPRCMVIDSNGIGVGVKMKI